MHDHHFLPYGKQTITNDDIAAVAAALKSDIITRGKQVEKFEEAFASYCGAKFAVAFSSGSSAMEAATRAADIGRFDRVITTPNTFVATIAPAIKQGATPVFLDIDRNTGNLNLEQLKHTLEVPFSRGQQVVIPVHFSGISVDMERLCRCLQNPSSVVIEDAAHALGSSYPTGEKVGSCAYSGMTVFSFHPVKTLTTGEGGMVTTNNPEYYEKLKRFRNSGIVKIEESSNPWLYDVEELSSNYNFTDFQAALGYSQLQRIHETIRKRQELAGYYRDQLSGIPHLQLFIDEVDSYTCFHLMVVQIDFDALGISRGDVMKQLFEKGIGTQVHYIPIYRHTFFKKQREDLSSYFPNMEAYYAQALSIPLFPEMEFSDVERVVSAIRQLLK